MVVIKKNMIVSRVVEISKKRKMMYSTIIALIYVCLIVNLGGDLFDYRRTSSIVSVSYLTAIIAICAFTFSHKSTVQILIPDILFVGYFLFAAFKNNMDFNINQLGDITLLLLYLSIRQIGSFKYRFLYAILLVSCFALSLFGYLQYANIVAIPNESYRVTGPFYNPAPYGALISIFLSTIAAVLIVSRGKVFLYTSICVSLFSIPALILSESRSAWLALIITSLSIILYKQKNKLMQLPAHTKSVWIVISLTTIALLCISLYHLRPESAKGRLLIWKISLEMIQDNPIRGLGYNGFQANYMNYQSEYFRHGKGSKTEKYLAGSVVSAYNEPLRITVEYGIVGLILYLSFIYIVIFRTHGKSVLFSAAKAAIIAYIIFGLFSYPNRIFSLQVFGVMSFALLLNTQNGTNVTVYFEKLNASLLRNTRCVLLLFALLLASSTFRLHTAYQRFQSLQNNPPENISEYLEELESVMSGDALFLQNFCVMVNHRVDHDLLLDKLNRTIQLSPSNTLYRMKGDCLNWMNRYEEAEHTYWKAHYMTPSQQQARASLVQLYLKQNKKVEAKKLTNQILNEKAKINGIDTYILHQELESIH